MTENSSSNVIQEIHSLEIQRIKSFTKRQGRITQGQERALAELMPEYGLDPNQPVDFSCVFKNDRPVILEIGFGNGDSLLKMAVEHPELNFIGIEVHRPGIGHLLLGIQERSACNIRIFSADAIEILENCIPDHSLERIQLFFPDPWHKKRHHKRRIVKRQFLEMVAQKLQVSGLFHAATDWEEYAMDMAQQLADSGLFESTQPTSPFCPRPEYRPQTKFETRGQRLGHAVWDLLWKRL